MSDLEFRCNKGIFGCNFHEQKTIFELTRVDVKKYGDRARVGISIENSGIATGLDVTQVDRSLLNAPRGTEVIFHIHQQQRQETVIYVSPV